MTVVTHNRAPILTDDLGLFLSSWGDVLPSAWVILPNHFHAIVPVANEPISTIMHRMKITYARQVRESERSGRVWQHRFWDHIIRDDADYRRHVDYVHYNPVKHGLVRDPFLWRFSSLATWAARGIYARDWGTRERPRFDGEYGE
ncbi:MAG TPA: transposase [Acidobacteriota bacterium]|nr:transposase [Acidobacteriota bacterium]